LGDVVNISSFLEEIDPYVSLGVNRCCFRGQAKPWPILPKAYREEFSGVDNKFVHLADNRLRQWEAESRSYLREMDAIPTSPWEWLATAQHFGLATKVVDWTSNPLIALFFAVSSHIECDGEFIAWSFEDSQYNPPDFPDEVKSVVIFRPAPTFARLRFQNGLLSYHPAPESIVPDKQLLRIKIPAESKVLLQDQLSRFGIDHASIFSSLDHLAEKINYLSINHIRKNNIK